MFDTNTQYALNKRNANAIVYVDAFGEKTEISTEALVEDEFAKWKALIDAELHVEEKEDHVYHNHTSTEFACANSSCCDGTAFTSNG